MRDAGRTIGLERAVNLEDVRRLARRRLPRSVFDILDGAADDELTLRRNREAYDHIEFRPVPLVDVSQRSTATTFFGQPAASPLMLAPTGAGRVVSRYAELAVARAAHRQGVVYMQSTSTAYDLEQVARESGGALWYQLYLPRTPDAVRTMIERVRDAGYQALAVTIDTPLFGNRERDIRNRVTLPARITPRLLVQGMSRPLWAMEFMRGNLLPRSSRAQSAGRLSAVATQQSILATRYPVTWRDIELVRAAWTGPLVIKGVMRADDCDRFVELGVDGLVVSNHGGRQLDGLPATIEVLPEVVAAASGRLEVFVDGGVRRGSDIAKALALGAQGVFVGRPYLFGLAAGGQHGVEFVIETLHRELDRTMALLGARTISEIDEQMVRRRTTREPNYN